MITVKIDSENEFAMDLSQTDVSVNNKLFESDWIAIGDNKFHVLINNRSFTVELISIDEMGKQLIFMLNGRKHIASIKDKYDVLLQQLGMDKLLLTKSNDIKAPMPGLVIRVVAQEGQAVKKGDTLLVLEAMKMENIIKAISDGVVKTIAIAAKQTVNKNQVLIVME